MFFYFVIAALLLVLVSGLGYRQLLRGGSYTEREKIQNQRRLLVPGPRGNIYDREGRLLVGNRPRFAVVLNLAELREEFRREYISIVRAYRDSEKEGDIARADRPRPEQLERISRATVVGRYLDLVNQILGRDTKLDTRNLERHFAQQLLLPYILIDELEPEEYARLIERLPVASPLQVYTSSMRNYPYGSLAAHTLGYIVINDDIPMEDFPEESLKTFALKGTLGKDGLERQHDLTLQGETGGSIYRVDPAGFKIDPPLERHLPVQGSNLMTSLDLDLQQAAEDGMTALGKMNGAVVALDVHTGEVLAMASRPDFDLNATSPRITQALVDQLNDEGGWLNRATSGLYPPGSTFKLITTMAGLRSGALDPAESTANCTGSMKIGGRNFTCDNGDGDHGVLNLPEAIAASCDIFFYTYGLKVGPDNIAAEAARFHLDRPTGIDLPGETSHMIIPSTAWKKQMMTESWFAGDTANMAIGQGFIRVTPLQMACFAASLARGETTTVPTLVHEPDRPTQHTEPIGLTPAQYHAVLEGMIGCTQPGGTAAVLTTVKGLRVPGVHIAGKTGTAQVRIKEGNTDIAWFICFAPAENPEIAMAVAVEGDTPGESFGGSSYAAPIASRVLQAYFAKKSRLPAASITAAP